MGEEIQEYYIANRFSIGELSEHVNKLIRQDYTTWKPIGGISISKDFNSFSQKEEYLYCQAMIRLKWFPQG